MTIGKIIESLGLNSNGSKPESLGSETLLSKLLLALPNSGGAFIGRVDFKTYTESKLALSYSSSIPLDLSTGTCFDVTLIGNTTFTFINCPNVANTIFSFTLIVRQDGVGSRTAAFPTNRPQGGTALALTTTANKIDILSFMTPDVGTTWFSNIAKNY